MAKRQRRRRPASLHERLAVTRVRALEKQIEQLGEEWAAVQRRKQHAELASKLKVRQGSQKGAAEKKREASKSAATLCAEVRALARYRHFWDGERFKLWSACQQVAGLHPPVVRRQEKKPIEGEPPRKEQTHMDVTTVLRAWRNQPKKVQVLHREDYLQPLQTQTDDPAIRMYREEKAKHRQPC